MAVLALGSLAGTLTSCSSDAPSRSTQAPPTEQAAGPIATGDAPLRVELVAEAVTAVEAERGQAQDYFEVNATPTIVNLFVATDDATQAVAYVYVAGMLGDPATPQPASGPTFQAAEIDFDESLVLAEVHAQLSSSDFRLFSITGRETGGVQYRTVINSAGGTEFVVFLSGTGAILGTDQDLGIGDS